MQHNVRTCPIAGASKSQIQANSLKDQRKAVAGIGKLKVYCRYTTFSSLFLLGQVKMSIKEVFIFILLHLYFTCPSGQVVIKTYVAPCEGRPINDNSITHKRKKDQ